MILALENQRNTGFYTACGYLCGYFCWFFNLYNNPARRCF